MVPLFFKAYKNDLTENDIFSPLKCDHSEILGESLEKVWKLEQSKNAKYALLKSLLKIFGLKWIALGLIHAIADNILVIIPPIAIGKIVSYFETEQKVISRDEMFAYVGVYVLAIFINRMIIHNLLMSLAHFCTQLRISCSALLYRKSLRLSRSSLQKTTVGQLVNLLSNDVSKFDQFLLAHFVYVAPSELIVGTYLIYREIGVHAFVGMAALLLFIFLQAYLGKIITGYRLKIALRSDERVRLMNEIISGIQVIKIYCWENYFSKLITEARKKEMQVLKNSSYFKAISMSFESFLTRMAIFVSLLSFVLTGNQITAQKVFTITAIYNILRQPVTNRFFKGVSSLGEVYVSIQRLQKFLSYSEQQQELKHLDKNSINGHISKSIKTVPKIVLQDLSAKWLESSSENVLHDLNLEWTGNQLIAIAGVVGSGKSSFLNVLLNETINTKGSVNIEGRLSYASQEPWLFPGTVRQNILFGQNFNQSRYDKVVEVCALKYDIEALPHGDNTFVGEKGKNLSGGQKARISLARCIYSDADIYLLDDPLSAVDTQVGSHLYKECIEHFLKDKMRILVTHQLQYLKTADEIVIMANGKIENRGSYNELQNSGLNFAKLLKPLNSNDNNKPEESILIQNDRQDIKKEKHAGPQGTKEEAKTGNISFKTFSKFFLSGGIFLLTVTEFLFVVSNVIGYGSEYFLAYWVNMEQNHLKWNSSQYLKPNESTMDIYFDDDFDRTRIIYFYIAIMLGTILFAIVRTICFMSLMIKISLNLHNSTFGKLIVTTMSFFNRNSSGQILNRFSKDLGSVDEFIPGVLYDVLTIGVLAISVIIISSIIEPWLIIPSVLMLFVFYYMRVIYIGTSRNVKRFEGIAKSPIFSHMSTSLNGLTTIRSAKSQLLLIKEFDYYQNQHTAANFMFIVSNRTFGFYIDMISLVFVALAILIMIFAANVTYGGNIGLVITQYIALNGVLQFGIIQSGSLETSMVSVERILEYSKLKDEPCRPKSTKSLSSWPQKGKIQFNNVNMQYGDLQPCVLQKLSFEVEPQAKIGIVGRTGAGKSSIITALFQLYDIKGNIYIDNEDITKLPLNEVRSKISIIPQDPVLFSGTLRKNLDPFDEISDETLWKILEQVHLKETVAEIPSGLNAIITEGGDNFSVGQKQLICLARALIRNNKILVLDEATANVDPQTDEFIQTTIKTKFSKYTVLIIAHRLHTVMDTDKILVMDQGRIQEFDHPYNLLSNKNSMLYKLTQASGSASFSELESLALKNYKNKNKELENN